MKHCESRNDERKGEFRNIHTGFMFHFAAERKTHKPELFNEAVVYDPSISDHSMVIGIMSENAINHPRKITFRSLKKVSGKSFSEDLGIAPWHVGVIFDSIDDQCFYWNSLLTNILDDHAPVKRMRVRKTDVRYND